MNIEMEKNLDNMLKEMKNSFKQISLFLGQKNHSVKTYFSIKFNGNKKYFLFLR